MPKYSIIIAWSEEDNAYIANILELKGCMADGRTREEALRELEIAKNLWIETALEDGEEIPEPNLFNAMSIQ